MDRRQFIRQGTLAMLWGLFGLAGPARAAGFGARPGAQSKPRIALIIDDIGFSRSRARAFLEIGVPMTFAVLPRLRFSKSLAFEIHEQGRQVMLHQPMEPFNAALDPGPGAVFVRDEPKKIVSTVQENLEEIPFVAGVNNHMGSRFTASSEKMSQVLPVIHEKGLFFVDSLTSGRSTAFRTAQNLHMPTASRNVFLDNRRDVHAILERLDQLRRHALTRGHAIGIGHPHPETSRAVKAFVSSLDASKVDLVHVSRLLEPDFPHAPEARPFR
jgi:uncharacterized protein